jgi:hypothetical protein
MNFFPARFVTCDDGMCPGAGRFPEIKNPVVPAK